jgi:hypothetical protein
MKTYEEKFNAFLNVGTTYGGGGGRSQINDLAALFSGKQPIESTVQKSG